MTQKENVIELLEYADPSLFRTIIGRQFNLDLPAISPASTTAVIRQRFLRVLSSLPAQLYREVEAWAESIVQLTDVVGRKVVSRVRLDHLDEIYHAEFDRLKNRYDRSLWLFNSVPALFQRARVIRDAALFDQGAVRYCGFSVPKHLMVKGDCASIGVLHSVLAGHLNCSLEHLVVCVRARANTDVMSENGVSLYHIGVGYNALSQIVETEKELFEHNKMERSVLACVTYEPSTGKIDGVFNNRFCYLCLIRHVVDLLFISTVSGEKIPIRQYDYQCLRKAFCFDIAGEPIDWVKVTQLGYSIKSRKMIFEISPEDEEDIHDAAASEITPAFRFYHRTLDRARISIRISKQGERRARIIHVFLSGENNCRIKAEYEHDYALCHRLLVKWKICKEIDHADTQCKDNP